MALHDCCFIRYLITDTSGDASLQLRSATYTPCMRRRKRSMMYL